MNEIDSFYDWLTKEIVYLHFELPFYFLWN